LPKLNIKAAVNLTVAVDPSAPPTIRLLKCLLNAGHWAPQPKFTGVMAVFHKAALRSTSTDPQADIGGGKV